ncbi:SDR family oxidoreductase [Mycobacterium koreense]|uniref:SDR family oxidoreductase n=1 Tax=Mycolicibacillus koreensis TaxID=1069220 RepID=UPI00138D189A|nr:SDR family oxidoreductase [Mycolicibacillus koreensis]MCV7247828.1 SDR family oxidoreductase [Mycolicibacillus koreensis]BBY53033.1 short-chain dehydrogenase [Mycolicibacillus koreensis]
MSRNIVVIGVSQGIGRGLAEEHLRRGWTVTGTVRTTPPDRVAGNFAIEMLDTTDEDGLQTVMERLPDGIDRLIVSAGIAGPAGPVGEVTAGDFLRTLEVNTLAPLRIIDRVAAHVTPRGMLVVLSSSQGSIALNDDAHHETYRISKAGLNMGLKSVAVRRDDDRTYVAMNPGWVRTEIGTERALLSVAESVPAVTDVLDALDGTAGIHFVDYQGDRLPW